MQMEIIWVFMRDMYWLSQQGPFILFQCFLFLICINFDCSNVLPRVAIGNPLIFEIALIMCSWRIFWTISFFMTRPKEKSDTVITVLFTLSLINLWIYFCKLYIFLYSVSTVIYFLALERREFVCNFRKENSFLHGYEQYGI